jgi:hypothetical protein
MLIGNKIFAGYNDCTLLPNLIVFLQKEYEGMQLQHHL